MSLHVVANPHKKKRTRRSWLAGLVLLTLPAWQYGRCRTEREATRIHRKGKLVSKSLARRVEHLRSMQPPQGHGPMAKTSGRLCRYARPGHARGRSAHHGPRDSESGQFVRRRLRVWKKRMKSR